MKLRIQDNNVRIRFTQGEILRMAEGRRIEQTTAFSISINFVTSVDSSRHIQRPIATFNGGCLTFQLPTDEVRLWATTDQVGIEAKQPIGNGEFLNLLFEKDFECLNPRTEEDKDAFPNPNSSGEA